MYSAGLNLRRQDYDLRFPCPSIARMAPLMKKKE